MLALGTGEQPQEEMWRRCARLVRLWFAKGLAGAAFGAGAP